ARLTPPPPSSPLFPYTTLFRSITPEDALLRVDEQHPVVATICDQQIAGNPAGGAAVAVAVAVVLLLVLPKDASPPQKRAQRPARSEEHTSELQSRFDLVCRLLL